MTWSRRYFFFFFKSVLFAWQDPVYATVIEPFSFRFSISSFIVTRLGHIKWFTTLPGEESSCNWGVKCMPTIASSSSWCHERTVFVSADKGKALTVAKAAVTVVSSTFLLKLEMSTPHILQQQVCRSAGRAKTPVKPTFEATRYFPVWNRILIGTPYPLDALDFTLSVSERTIWFSYSVEH